MSMQPAAIGEIPAETRQVAQAAFPKGNLYMRMRDELGVLYSDDRFTDLFPERGQPAESPGRLALVTIMPFAEGLSDRQAADAVRARIDWKYALGLELTDSGFDFSVLSRFRSRPLGVHAANMCERDSGQRRRDDLNPKIYFSKSIDTTKSHAIILLEHKFYQ